MALCSWWQNLLNQKCKFKDSEGTFVYKIGIAVGSTINILDMALKKTDTAESLVGYTNFIW